MTREHAKLSISEVPSLTELIKGIVIESIHITIPTEAVSLQASRARKEALTSLIRSLTRSVDIVLTDDVAIGIEWYLHPRRRYESDSAPDVDNIIKPTLDALCGPDGIVIDDCQVRFISCNWIDWNEDDEHIKIHIEFDQLGFEPKKDLLFVHLEKGICFPFVKSGTPDSCLDHLKHVESAVRRYLETRAKEDNYYAGIEVKPAIARRFFHISRLREFSVVKVDDLKKQLESECLST